MSAILTSLIVFVCVLGGAFLGMRLGRIVPESHLDPDSKDVVRISTGVVATMVALVLGLLIASAKSFYDTQNAEITQLSANVIILDRVLAHYGPEAKPDRDQLRDAVNRVLDSMWSSQRSGLSQAEPQFVANEPLYSSLENLKPKSEEQRDLKTQALTIALSTAQLRWLMFTQRATTLPVPLIVALIVWLTLVFISTGLFARPNLCVNASFFAAALSVSGAIWLIWEMYTPYGGLIRISDGALRAALSQLGQ